MKTVIVSGANGFVGSALVKELLKYDYRIFALGREGRISNFPEDSRLSLVSCYKKQYGSYLYQCLIYLLYIYQ